MPRSVNGFVGTFESIAALTAKYTPAEHAGCSANVGTAPPYTKAWSDGVSWAGLNATQIDNILAPGLLSGVTYDTSNRAITWTIDGVAYTASYSSFEIVVAGTDGTITRISLDPAVRITGVSTA